MGLVNSQVFIGTRCRLCRHKDARFINGWIEFFRGESLLVLTEDASGCEPGDHLFLEAYGHRVKGSADTTLVAVSADDEGEENSGTTKLSLRLNETIRVTDHNEPSRVLVRGMGAEITFNGTAIRAKVRDVSVNGVGIVSEQEVPKGSEIGIVIGTAMGPIKAQGKVRHVRKANDEFRLGIELVQLSRLDGSRWRKLMGEAA